MTRTDRLKLTFLSASALTGFALATPALAQDQLASADTAVDGNEIIVTATRRAISIQDVPINISAISPADLQTNRIDDVRDIGAFTPGITVTDTGPRGAGTVVMRGLSADDSSSFGSNSDSAIGTYLGEIPLYLDFKLIDLQRVEVLLGPQGTLYGLGTLAGAIRYIPNRPDPTKWSAEVHGRAYDVAHSKGIGYVGDVTLNIPIVKDAIAFRTTTGYYYDPGFIDYPFLVKDQGVSIPQPGPVGDPLGSSAQQDANFDGKKDVNFEKTFTTRNQLGLTGENFKAYLTYAYQQTKTDGRQANGGGVVGEGRYEGPWRVLEPSNRQSHLLALEVDAEVEDFANVVFASAYTKTTNHSSVDVTDLLIDLDYGYELWPSFTAHTDQHAKSEQYNQEVRLVSNHGGPFSWVVGAFWNRLNTDGTYKEIAPNFSEFSQSPEGQALYGYFPYLKPDNTEYASYTKTKTDEKAVFGEGTLRITDEWQVTAGIRYFKYDAFVVGGTALPLYQPGPDIVYRGRSGSTKDDGTVWKFNTSYNITPDIMVWGTYSKGYRIGGVNRVAPCADPLPPGQNLCALPNELSFGPDKVKNKEVGIRSELFDKRLTLNLSAYHIKWDGIQLSGQTVNGAIGIIVNGGTATSKGIDGSFVLRPIDNLTIRGNYSYLDAKLTSDVPELLSVQGGSLVGVFDGDRLPGSAKNSGALGATYSVPIGDNSVDLNWTATYTGNILTRPGMRGGGETLPSYVMHRASIMYRTDAWEFGVYSTNIFDKYAITGVSNDLTRRNFVNDGILSRYYARSVAQPRVVGVEGRVKF